MNKQIELLMGHRTTIISSLVSLAGGFAIGYAVRATKYEKLTVDEDSGKILDANGEELSYTFDSTPEVRAKDLPPEWTPEQVHEAIELKRKEALDKKIKDQEFIDKVKREQDAIKEELRSEGTPFEEYDTVIDDGIEAYPAGKPNPADIQVAVTDPITDWDWDSEKKYRLEHPDIYVLHRDEFYDDEMSYSQTTLSYYNEDDIMVSEDDSPIPGYSKITGPLKFGKGSGDENVFHVRNTELHAEYEIINIDGSYMREVLGLDPSEELVE